MVFSKINFPIYGIIIILSIIIGCIYIFRSLKKDNFKDKNLYLYFIMLIPFIIIIGILYTSLLEHKEEGMVIGLSSYGGLIGAISASIVFEKILPSGNKTIKYTILAMPLIYGLSKIACFIVGCCYGLPYDGFLSITYTHGLNIPLFPVQLLEVVLNLILFIILNRFKHTKHIIPITLISASFIKLATDFLRYDHLTKIITTNQIISIIVLVIGVIVLLYERRKYNEVS